MRAVDSASQGGGAKRCRFFAKLIVSHAPHHHAQLECLPKPAAYVRGYGDASLNLCSLQVLLVCSRDGASTGKSAEALNLMEGNLKMLDRLVLSQ
jgi:hypothetical protein